MARAFAVVVALVLICGNVGAQRATEARAERDQQRSRESGAAEAGTLEALPGTVVRWSVPGTTRCGMGGRSWLALQETCYYPIDLLQKPAVIRVSRHGAGRTAFARIRVLPRTFEPQDITLGDIPQAHPTAADLRRNAREEARVRRLWARRERPALFTLPLARPTTSLPDPSGFGSKYVFNGNQDATEIHNGADYEIPAGTAVAAVADGMVVLADNLFFSGNAVFIDHGNGLFSEYFHLGEIRVRDGEAVKKGDALGVVGSTGRVTGPHLHLGFRWHGARVDPAVLLGDPARMPAITP